MSYQKLGVSLEQYAFGRLVLDLGQGFGHDKDFLRGNLSHHVAGLLVNDRNHSPVQLFIDTEVQLPGNILDIAADVFGGPGYFPFLVFGDDAVGRG